MVLDVTATWAMWALRERGLHRYVDETVDAVVAAGPQMVDLLDDPNARVARMAAGLDVPDGLRPRVEEVLVELARVCVAVLDEEFLMQAAVVLGDIAGVEGSGLARGRADIWAGGILYALGQDVELWSPYGDRYVPPDQLARIVGASRASLIKRANEVRDLVQRGRA